MGGLAPCPTAAPTCPPMLVSLFNSISHPPSLNVNTGSNHLRAKGEKHVSHLLVDHQRRRLHGLQHDHAGLHRELLLRLRQQRPSHAGLRLRPDSFRQQRVQFGGSRGQRLLRPQQRPRQRRRHHHGHRVL